MSDDRASENQIQRARGRWAGVTLRQRFEDKCIPEPNTGCLLWLGAVDRRGYGQIRIDGRNRVATHIALELAGRPLRAQEWALHRCDTPGCVEPSHLFGGDHSANMRDCRDKGRMKGVFEPLSRCPKGHEFSPENIRVPPDGRRRCRECTRERDRKYRALKAAA